MKSCPRSRLAVAVLLLACSSTGDARSGQRSAIKPQRIYTETPATWFEDMGRSARVSPDGRWALYGGRGRIRLIELASGREDAQRLAGGLDEVRSAVFDATGQLVRQGRRGNERGWFLPDGAGLRLSALPSDAVPAWSPDRVHLAFYRIEDPQPRLFVGTLEGQTPYALQAQITGFAWSPDGSAIYVTVCDERGVSSLVRVARAGGQQVTVARDLDASPSFSPIAVSPDGRRVYIALASDSAPQAEARHQPKADRDLDIYEIDVNTGARRVKVQTSADEFAPAVAAGNLYWTRNDVRDAVVVAPVTGGQARLVIENAQIPYWSPDGKQIAFTHGGWRIADWALNLDAAVMDIDSQGRAVSRPRPIVVGYHEDFTPAWSPDGQWIAYHSHRSPTPVVRYDGEGSTDDIYLRRISAPLTDEIRLTDFGWEVGMADWSPDGTKLVFCSWDKGGPRGISKPWIVTIDRQTGKALRTERLTLPEPIKNAETAVWSPKGDEIAIEEQTAPDRHTLWVVKADGSRAEKLIEYPLRTLYGGLDWTPDGKALIYTAQSGERLQLFSISRSGAAPRRLTEDSANLFLPQVSPDGRWIGCTRIQRSKEIWRLKL